MNNLPLIFAQDIISRGKARDRETEKKKMERARITSINYVEIVLFFPIHSQVQINMVYLNKKIDAIMDFNLKVRYDQQRSSNNKNIRDFIYKVL